MASSSRPHRRPTARRCLRTLALASTTAAALVLAACSGTDDDASETVTTSGLVTTTTAVDPGPGPTSLEGVTIDLEPVAEGLDSPVAVAARPGKNQLWVAERSGRLRVVAVDTEYDEERTTSELKGYTLLEGDALDLSELTTTDGERGLLGLAFSTDGRTLYVDHTLPDGDIAVASYEVEDRQVPSTTQGGAIPSASSVVDVDPESRIDLLTVEHRDHSNHNGGQLTLGADGFLYIGVGDGGGSGDPDGNAQDTDSLLGTILRIDPSGATADEAYAIPSSNPFAQGGGRPEIFLYGVRNPWRFSFDRETGDLWLADVGQDAVEEIDWLPADSGAGRGANLGWNWFEGDRPFRTDGTPPDGLLGPILTYTHDDGGCSVTGGHVYRGEALPDLDGTYLYGDYCTGEVRGLLARRGIVLDDRGLAQVEPGTLVSFGRDDAGELFVVSTDGTVSKVVG